MPTKRFENLDEERRRKILDIAGAEFSQKGFEGSSLNTIIQKAKISKGSMYYYFEDKEDLYLTVLKQAMSDFAELVGGIATGTYTDDFWGDIREFYTRVLEVSFARPELISLVGGYFSLSGNKYGSGTFVAFYHQIMVYIENIIVRGQEMGAVRTDIPLDLLVTIICSMGEAMDFWVVTHWEELSTKKPRKTANQMIKIFRRVAAK